MVRMPFHTNPLCDLEQVSDLAEVLLVYVIDGLILSYR